MVCPYKVAVALLTVAFAALVAFSVNASVSMHMCMHPCRTFSSASSCCAGKSISVLVLATQLALSQDVKPALEEEKKRRLPAWMDLSQYKDTRLYKLCYFGGMVLLVLFHLELFSGGFICKQIFSVR